MPLLYAESFAPWCEKARWALDHHGITYRYREHVPLIGELALKVAARRPFGRVTVPLLVDGGRVLMDSVAIARYAEERGAGTPLFPPSCEDEIAAWSARSEVMMTAGRAMLLPRMSRMRDALREQQPPSVPEALRGALTPITANGVAHLMRKYGVRPGDDASHEAASREVLDALRAVLSDGRAQLLGDGLSFADVAVATSLQFVLPVAERFISLGPATRDAWIHRGLAADYPDLLAWRDRLYDAHRHPRGSARWLRRMPMQA